MSVDGLKGVAASIRRPVRVKRSAGRQPNTVDVGPGTKWNNPIKKRDVEALVSSEPDIAAAVQKGGWKAGAVILYRDHLLEVGLDPSETYRAPANLRNRATPTFFLSLRTREGNGRTRVL